MVPVGLLLLGQWLHEPQRLNIGHRMVSLCLVTCMMAQEVGNVGIRRTSVSNPVLFHRVAKRKPQQAGEISKVLGGSSDLTGSAQPVLCRCAASASLALPSFMCGS